MAALLLSVTFAGDKGDSPAIAVELLVEEEPPPPSPPEEPPPPKPQSKPTPTPLAPKPLLTVAPAALPELPITQPVEETSVPALAVVVAPPIPAPSTESLRQSYALALWHHIQLFKPLKLRAEGTALASFTLSAQGMLISSEISSSSGQARLDEAALESLRRAQPFPPRPSGLGLQPLSFTIPFQFKARSP